MRNAFASSVHVVPALALAVLGTCCAQAHPTSATAPTPVPSSSPSPSQSPKPSRHLTITGVLREANGGPLANAAICSVPLRAPVSQISSTGANGSFRVEQFAADGL